MLSRKLEQGQDQSQGHSVRSLVLPTHISTPGDEDGGPPGSLGGWLGTGYTQEGLYNLKLAPQGSLEEQSCTLPR